MSTNEIVSISARAQVLATAAAPAVTVYRQQLIARLDANLLAEPAPQRQRLALPYVSLMFR